MDSGPAPRGASRNDEPPCAGGRLAVPSVIFSSARPNFVAMLAFSLPGVDVSYDPLLTLLSLAIPVVVAAAAFVVVSQRPTALVVAGIAMGLAISGMHYTGMGAMRMAASIHYDPVWVALSIAIAIGASIIALRLAFHMTSVLERVSAR